MNCLRLAALACQITKATLRVFRDFRVFRVQIADKY